jgi:ABC-type oligopeptide transport system substrate-binding subunit
MKKNSYKLSRILKGILLIAGLLIYLPGQADDVASSAATKFPPYLRLPIDGAITTLDPGLTEDTASIELVEQLFLGLTDFDPVSYDVAPELATNWEVSEDGLEYHFYLRSDVQWTDGTPVTAHDVVWAIHRNLIPDLNATYTSMLFILENAEAFHLGEIKDSAQIGVHALNDYELVFKLKHPAAYFPAAVSSWIFRPLPRKTIENFGDKWTLPENIVSNGSYQLKEWKKGRKLILEKNPNYYDADHVAIKEVHYIVVMESSIGLIMYENGELDVLGGFYLPIPTESITRVRSDPQFRGQYTVKPRLCTYYYGFNTKRYPVDNPLVRKAIVAAVDRELIIDLVTRGDEAVATTFTRPPVISAVLPEAGVGIDFDPEQARLWLAEAGFPDGEGFPPISLAYNFSEIHAKIAEAVQVMLEYYLNIEVVFEPMAWEDYNEVLGHESSPHIYRSGWCSDYPDANNWLFDVFHPTYSSNLVQWQNTFFAESVEKAQGETDPEKRRALYQKAEEILTEQEAVIMPLYHYSAPYLVRPRVKNWYGMAFGGQHIRNWKLDESPEE